MSDAAAPTNSLVDKTRAIDAGGPVVAVGFVAVGLVAAGFVAAGLVAAGFVAAPVSTVFGAVSGATFPTVGSCTAAVTGPATTGAEAATGAGAAAGGGATAATGGTLHAGAAATGAGAAATGPDPDVPLSAVPSAGGSAGVVTAGVVAVGPRRNSRIERAGSPGQMSTGRPLLPSAPVAVGCLHMP